MSWIEGLSESHARCKKRYRARFGQSDIVCYSTIGCSEWQRMGMLERSGLNAFCEFISDAPREIKQSDQH